MKRLHATSESLENLYTLDPHDIDEGTNAVERERMKKYIDGVMSEFLTERQRQVYTMYFGESLNSVEISKSLGISPKTVRSILKVSIKKMEHHKKFFLKWLTKV